MFDPTRGVKAYSYFGTIVKRHLINYNNKNYKKLKQVGSFEELEDSYEVDGVPNSERKVSLAIVVNAFVENSYENIEQLFPKEQDQKVADAILTLFNTRHDLEIFRKKALYIYIREIVDIKTPRITKVASELGDLYKKHYAFYLENGYANF